MEDNFDQNKSLSETEIQNQDGTEQENEKISEEPESEEIYKFRKEVIVFLLSFTVILFFSIIYLFTPVIGTHKPAVYLYPEKTTKITIKLDNSIKYNNVIPKYKDKWYVEAEPNGFIRDLQPKYTKCDKLAYKKFGFEYSKQACEINKYPYIYWDGIQLSKPLPGKKEGFIVQKENIEEFLSKKADEMKFNENEKKEFVRYWTKTISEKNWKYLKIYFLQNEEVDNYYPIYVEPKPDSSNRVQMVIKKAKKKDKAEEQKLKSFIREGFTLVEWGGIIDK